MAAAEGRRVMAKASEAKTLAMALLEAQRAIKNVAPDAKNKHHGYAYASAEAIIRDSREVLGAAGLTVWPKAWLLLPPEYVKVRHEKHDADTQIPAMPTDAILDVTFVLEHGASGESREHRVQFPALEVKGRPLDKAMAAALTSATGYFLRGLLNLSRIDPADDISGRDDSKDDNRYRGGGGRRSGGQSGGAASTQRGPKPIKNKYANPCAICKDNVPEGEGWAKKENDAAPWLTYHDNCARKAKAEREAAVNAKPPSDEPPDDGPPPNWNDDGQAEIPH